MNEPTASAVAERDGAGAAPAGGGPSLRRRAIRGGGQLMAARLGLQLLSWGVTIAVARFLRSYDYGVLTAGAILLELADRLAEVGIGKELVRRPELADEDAAEAFTISAGLSVVMYAGLFALAPAAAAYFRTPEVAGYLRAAGLLVLLIPLRAVPLAILERGLRMKEQSAVQLAGGGVQSAVVLGLAAGGAGYWSLVGGAFAGRVLETGMLMGLARWRPRLRWPGPGGRGMIRFGVHITGAGLVWHVYSNLDYAILGRLAGPVALGYYALAFNLVTLPVNRLTGNAAQVAYPIFCRLQHDRRRMWDWYLRFLVVVSLAGLPAMVGLALVADDAIPLVLGAKWVPAVAPLRIMSVAGGVMVVANSLTPMFNVLNRPDLNLKYAVACLAAMGPSFYALGTAYGATGVALAWAIVYPVVALGRVWATRAVTGVGLGELLGALRPVLQAVGVMAALVAGVRGLVGGPGPSWARLGAAIAAGVAGYAGAVAAFGRRTVLPDVRAIVREVRSR